jgi:hypothetical protein
MFIHVVLRSFYLKNGKHFMDNSFDLISATLLKPIKARSHIYIEVRDIDNIADYDFIALVSTLDSTGRGILLNAIKKNSRFGEDRQKKLILSGDQSIFYVIDDTIHQWANVAEIHQQEELLLFS